MQKLWKLVLLLLVLSVISAGSYAQDKRLIPVTRYPSRMKDTATKVQQDTAEQSDLNDVFQYIFTKNYKPAKNDTISRKPIISFVPAVGYSLQTEAAITLSGNIVFRDSPDTKISAITTSMGFTQRRQFTLPVVSNIWTTNNSFLFVGDSRFYIYPQSTYGLGSNSDIENKQHMRYNLLRISEVAYKRISGNFFLGAGYRMDDHWNISSEPPKDGGVSDYQAYGATARSLSSG